MTPAEQIELTIRAAKVIRVLSELVDCRSKQIARMVMQEAAPEIQKLVAFVTAEGKTEK